MKKTNNKKDRGYISYLILGSLVGFFAYGLAGLFGGALVAFGGYFVKKKIVYYWNKEEENEKKK